MNIFRDWALDEWIMAPAILAFEGTGWLADKLGIEDDFIALVLFILCLPFILILLLVWPFWGGTVILGGFIYGVGRILTYPFRRKK